MLVELQDGGIEEIYADSFGMSGCETCNYGSEYTNEYTIQMTKGTLDIKVNQEYKYALSDGDMMKLMLQKVEEIKVLTEDEFVKWIEEAVGSLVEEKNNGYDYKESNFTYTPKFPDNKVVLFD